MVKTTPGEKAKINILFVHYGDDWLRGSERCLLDLLTHLDKARFNPVVWCNSAVFADEVSQLNISVFRNDFPILFGWCAPRFDIPAYFTLIKRGINLVKRHHIDIIHANSGAPNQWLFPVSRICNKPLLAHLHSPYIFRDRLTLGLHQVSVAVGVSNAVISPLLDDGVESERTHVIYNGLDTKRLLQQKPYDLRRALGIAEDALVLITIASLIRRKGIDLIIRALREVRNLGVPASLVVVGDGEELDALKSLTTSLNLGSQVYFLGQRYDSHSLMTGGADVLVSGAREEAFGLTLAEAGLAHLPVIAPATGGIYEVIEHGKNGLLYETENIRQLSTAIQTLYHNPLARNEMGSLGFGRVMSQFTIEKNVAAFQALYRDLVATSSRQRIYPGLAISLLIKRLIKLMKPRGNHDPQTA